MNRILNMGLLTLLLFTSCNKKKNLVVQPVIAPITEAVFAPGHLEATNQFTLTALNDGYIMDVPVKEGDEVKEGQTLFVQDNKTAVIQQHTAHENLQIARQQSASNSAVLQQLQAQLGSANQKLQTNKTQLDRLLRLYTSHSVAKVDVDNAQLAYDNSVNDVAAIKQNIAATQLNLKQSLVNSQGQLQTAIANTGYYNIKSPGAYKVFVLLKRKGEFVRKGDAVATLGRSNDLTIVLNIEETSIAKIQVKQKVLVELNTEKGKTYIAYISKIYPSFDEATQSYKVEAVFANPVAHLINGTLLQANIIVAKKNNVLLIPRGCLSTDGKVIKQQHDKLDTLSVTTGIISTDWVEVIQGVSLNDKLVKSY